MDPPKQVQHPERHDFAVRDGLVAMAENILGMLVSAANLTDTNAILRLLTTLDADINSILLPPPLPMRRQMSVPSHPEVDTMPPVDTMPSQEVSRAYLVETVVSNLGLQALSKNKQNTLVNQLLKAHDTLRELREHLSRTDDVTRALELAQELVRQLRLSM